MLHVIHKKIFSRQIKQLGLFRIFAALPARKSGGRQKRRRYMTFIFRTQTWQFDFIGKMTATGRPHSVMTKSSLTWASYVAYPR